MRNVPVVRTSLVLAACAVATIAGIGAAGCGQPAANQERAPAPKEAPAPASGTAPGTVTATATTTVKIAPPTDTPAPESTAPNEDIREGTAPGDRLPNFTATTLVVVDGKVTETAYDHSKATGTRVYVVNSTTCPYCKKYGERMGQIETAYAAKGVAFVYLYPDKDQTPEEKQAWHTSKGYKAPWVVDKGGAATQVINGSKTPEYVVVNAQGIVTYRGGIDDSMGAWKTAKEQYLTDALDATLAGKPVAVPETTAAG